MNSQRTSQFFEAPESYPPIFDYSFSPPLFRLSFGAPVSGLMPESKLIELAEKLDDAEKTPLTVDLPDLFRDVPWTRSPGNKFQEARGRAGGRDRVGLKHVRRRCREQRREEGHSS
jgi:hypothetical protein